jgi:hypothetical protein
MGKINIDLTKIIIDPLVHQGGKERWAEEYKQLGLKEEEIKQEVEKRESKKKASLIAKYERLYLFLEPGLKHIHGEAFDDAEFYKLINDFDDGWKFLDFIFSVDFLYYVDEYIDKRASGIKTLFLISFIESLTTHNYIRLHDWLKDSANKDIVMTNLKDLDDKNIQQKMGKLCEIYFEKYGAFRKVFNFLNQYLLEEDKFWLLQEITFKRAEGGKGYQPICFSSENKDCQRRGDSLCCYECKIEKDKMLLNEAFKKLIKELYNMRSEFVHNAKYVDITVPDDINVTSVFDAYKKGQKYISYVSDVKYEDFKKLVVTATVRYLKDKGKNHARSHP